MLAGVQAAFACTSLIAGKNATADGSTMITYNADAYVLYGELYRQPAADHKKGEMLDIKEWDTHKYLGQIEQVEHTYATVGNMNEHQLAITETTFDCRPELADTTAIMDYGSLIYVTLQRAHRPRGNPRDDVARGALRLLQRRRVVLDSRPQRSVGARDGVERHG